MTARPLTQSSRVRRPPWLWDHSTTAHTPTSWPSLSPPCDASRNASCSGAEHNMLPIKRTNMRNIRARLVIWFATKIVMMIDRSLQMPQELDEI